LQIVAPDEVRPDLNEDIELIDVEDPTGGTLLVDRGVIDGYCERLEEQAATLRAFCFSQGLPWLRLESDTPFKPMVAAVENAGLLTAAS
jgi:hypothetical protein